MVKIYDSTEVVLHDTLRVDFFILHDICVVSMVSVLPWSKTAYLGIAKNRLISRSKKKMIQKGIKEGN